VNTRPARADDAAVIARIYNEGIEDGFATFETRSRTADDVERWLEEGVPVVVGEEDGKVVSWAAAHAYRPSRDAYSGIGEFSIYVAREARGRGAGKATLAALDDVSLRVHVRLGARNANCVDAELSAQPEDVLPRHARIVL